jgi:hypothetical protein
VLINTSHCIFLPAPRHADGIYSKAGVKNARAKMTRTPTMTPPAGVETFDCALTELREKEPVTGYELTKEPKKLDMPIATSSWDVEILDTQ